MKSQGRSRVFIDDEFQPRRQSIINDADLNEDGKYQDLTQIANETQWLRVEEIAELRDQDGNLNLFNTFEDTDKDIEPRDII